MKEKTREKLAARGIGPLVRPGRPGRGRRGALAPERAAGAGGEAAVAAAAEAQPVVRDDGPLGEFVEPSAGSVRQRVRLRPVVREALDAEAGRLGMTREGFCRFVLEEVARKAAGGPLSGDGGAEDAAEASASGVVVAEDGPTIPAGYVGLEEEEGPQGSSPGAGPVVAGADGGADASAARAPDPDPAGRALLPVGRGSRGDRVPVGALRGARRLRCPGGRVRVRVARAVLAALVLLGVLTAAAAVSWRYEVAATGGDGVYVVDRWRGEVWRCGRTGSSRPATCVLAVFRQPAAAREAVRLGRTAP